MKKFTYEINHFKGMYHKGYEILYSFDEYIVTGSAYPSRGQNYCIYAYEKCGFELKDFADTLDQAIDLIFKRYNNESVIGKYTTITRCPHCGKEEIEIRFYELNYQLHKNEILCNTLVNENGVEVSIQKPTVIESCCSACYDERVELGLEDELPF